MIVVKQSSILMNATSLCLIPRGFCGLALLFLVLEPSHLQAQQPAAQSGNNSVITFPIISLDAYRAKRTPVITLNLGKPRKGSFAAKLAHINALAGADAATATPLDQIQPQSHNGVFDEVNLGYLNGGTAPAAGIALQFDASQAGETVWVQPLDGGSILTQDIDGNPVSSPAGCTFALDASGQVAFSYQALALPGRYQVLIRLGNVSMMLPIVIPDPNQD